MKFKFLIIMPLICSTCIFLACKTSNIRPGEVKANEVNPSTHNFESALTGVCIHGQRLNDQEYSLISCRPMSDDSMCNADNINNEITTSNDSNFSYPVATGLGEEIFYVFKNNQTCETVCPSYELISVDGILGFGTSRGKHFGRLGVCDGTVGPDILFPSEPEESTDTALSEYKFIATMRAGAAGNCETLKRNFPERDKVARHQTREGALTLIKMGCEGELQALFNYKNICDNFKQIISACNNDKNIEVVNNP